MKRKKHVLKRREFSLTCRQHRTGQVHVEGQGKEDRAKITSENRVASMFFFFFFDKFDQKQQTAHPGNLVNPSCIITKKISRYIIFELLKIKDF